jgi:DNA-directed RNA polymerase subunit RPC12/RpoP
MDETQTKPSAVTTLAAVKALRATKPSSGFACMECGHKFRTIAAAQKAAFGDNGCPKCGGADIDLG